MVYYEFKNAQYYALVSTQKPDYVKALKLYHEHIEGNEGTFDEFRANSGIVAVEIPENEALLKFLKANPKDMVEKVIERFNAKRSSGVLLVDGSLI